MQCQKAQIIESSALISNDTLLRNKYYVCANEWRPLVRSNQLATEAQIIDANNVGALYRFINRRIANRSCIV